MLSPLEYRELLPMPLSSQQAIAAPGIGTGNWAGAPSAAEMNDGTVLMAARIRTPENRGGSVDIFRSANGVNFDPEPIFSVDKDEMDAASLERAKLMQTLGRKWRLYLSCATIATDHWRVEMLEADAPDGFDPASRITVMDGGIHEFGLKDPVIEQLDEQYWHAFVTAHPLEDPNATDRMNTWAGFSFDGLNWTWSDRHALTPQTQEIHGATWYHRGLRGTAVNRMGQLVAVMFDGRRDAASNYEEGTGLAIGELTGDSIGELRVANHVGRVCSPFNGGALRYADILRRSNGQDLLYYEMSVGHGEHELRVENRGRPL